MTNEEKKKRARREAAKAIGVLLAAARKTIEAEDKLARLIEKGSE